MKKIKAVGIVLDDCIVKRHETFASGYYPALIEKITAIRNAGITPFLLTLESLHAARMAATLLLLAEEDVPIIFEYGSGLYYPESEECEITPEIKDHEEESFEQVKSELVDLIDGNGEEKLPYGVIHFTSEHTILASLNDPIDTFRDIFLKLLQNHDLTFDPETNKGDICLTVLQNSEDEQILIHVPSANFTHGINAWLTSQDMGADEIALIATDIVHTKILDQIGFPMTTQEHILTARHIESTPKGYIASYDGILGVIDCLEYLAKK